MNIFHIDGAVMFKDLKEVNGSYEIPPVDCEYKYALMQDGILFASKNGKDYFIALDACIDGKSLICLLREGKEGAK